MDPTSGHQTLTEVPAADDHLLPSADPVLMAGSALGAFLVVLLVILGLVVTSPARPARARPAPHVFAPPPAAEPAATIAAPAPPDSPTTPIAIVDPAGGLVARLRSALGRSRAVLQERFDALFGRPVDDSLYESLEEALLSSDVGVPTTTRLVDRVRREAGKGKGEGDLRAVLREEMLALFDGHDPRLHRPEARPWVILIVGVNGSGKTTTIGKLAARFGRAGMRVLIAAGDTYRAAASEQLVVWAERAGADIVTRPEGSDPSAVVYEALDLARAKGHDVVIVDTAGRLQTRKPLMEQLSKLRRVMAKSTPGAPHETLMVLDGTVGQNGLSQARLFHEATPLTGVVVTKLDGTAKGGMILTIAAELGLSVKLIGIGEAVDDLRDFDPRAFVDALG